MDLYTIKYLLGVSVVFGQILFLMLLVARFSPTLAAFKPIAWVRHHALTCAFVVALTGTLGSLFLSDVLGWEPCVLCWYQRIALYPLVAIFGIALWKKKHDAFLYSLPFVFVGAAIGIYHYSIQVLSKFGTEVACSSTGVSCAASPVWEFGYVTVPLMALTGFMLILVLYKKE